MIKIKTLNFVHWQPLKEGLFQVDIEMENQLIARVFKASMEKQDYRIEFFLPFYTERLIDRYVELTHLEQFSMTEGFTKSCENFSHWLDSEWQKQLLRNEVATILKDKLLMLKQNQLVQLDSETLIQDYEAAKRQDDSLVLLNHLPIEKSMRLYYQYVYQELSICD